MMSDWTVEPGCRAIGCAGRKIARYFSSYPYLLASWNCLGHISYHGKVVKIEPLRLRLSAQAQDSGIESADELDYWQSWHDGQSYSWASVAAIAQRPATKCCHMMDLLGRSREGSDQSYPFDLDHIHRTPSYWVKHVLVCKCSGTPSAESSISLRINSAGNLYRLPAVNHWWTDSAARHCCAALKLTVCL